MQLDVSTFVLKIILPLRDPLFIEKGSSVYSYVIGYSPSGSRLSPGLQCFCFIRVLSYILPMQPNNDADSALSARSRRFSKMIPLFFSHRHQILRKIPLSHGYFAGTSPRSCSDGG